MSKLSSVLLLSILVNLQSFNPAAASQCGLYLNSSPHQDFTATFFVNPDGTLDVPLELNTNPANIQIKDRIFVDSMNEVLFNNLNFMDKLSPTEIALINDGLLRFKEGVTSPKDIPYYFKLLLAVTQFHMPEGNNFVHADKALKILKSIPAVLQYRDYRVMYFIARSLLVTENPLIKDRYLQVIRITNTLVGGRNQESLDAAIDLSNRLIRTNIGSNIDAGLELRDRALQKLSRN